ncbi:hypothetical protein AB0758_48465 [Tolypothrix bouteillei VB521301_2]|uniref:hypothetical protein n=1 Tax=Tolypothrix bouteillei TaxID=1246981 RepID=UPI0038B4535E
MTDLRSNVVPFGTVVTPALPIEIEKCWEWVEYCQPHSELHVTATGFRNWFGNRLLLSRIAKGCQKYWGTDYSIAAIQHVEQVRASVEGLEHVRLLHQMADNFAGIPREFDTNLNSIVRVFPQR